MKPIKFFFEDSWYTITDIEKIEKGEDLDGMIKGIEQTIEVYEAVRKLTTLKMIHVVGNVDEQISANIEVNNILRENWRTLRYLKGIRNN
jgi:hypothetical protein